jgi:hypothetical protein
MRSRQPMPLPLGISIGLDLVLGACATAVATLNWVISAQGFIHNDTHTGVGGLLLGLSYGLIAGLLLVGAFLLWRRRPRGLVMSIGGAMLVFAVAWQAAGAGDFVVAAVLVASSIALVACFIARSTNRALGGRRPEKGKP